MNMSVQSRNKQGGFTLIEIAIVLVIIGLLLGGVLQGQQLIQNSRVKAATNDFNGIVTAMLSYRDRYGRLPGDDGPSVEALNARGGAWGSVTGFGNADGILNAPAAETFKPAITTEGGVTIFQHLRAAGFITGDAGSTALPQNPFGGFIGVTTEAVLSSGGGGTTVPTMSGVKVCMSNVNGTAVLALDTQLDDGVTNTGRFRVSEDTDGRSPPDENALPNADAVDENANYTVCLRAI